MENNNQKSKRQTKNARRRVKARTIVSQFNKSLRLDTIPNTTRSGVMPNPADPRKIMGSLGDTVCGAQWALKVLHPCGEHNNMVPKIPDGSASESVALERRDEFVLAKPNSLSAETFSAIVIELPLMQRATVFIAGVSSSLTVPNILGALDYALAGTNINLFYPSWHSFASPDTGTVYVSVARAAILDNDMGDVSVGGEYADKFNAVRRSYCGLTLDFDANSVTDKGRVTSGQFQSILDERTVSVMDNETGDVATIVDVFSTDLVPVTTTDIVQNDSLRRQCEAKTGEYAPMRIWQPTVPLVPSKAARPIIDTDFDVSINPSTAPLNLWFSGWGSYVSIWSDIDATSSIRIKRVEGLELTMGGQSVYGPFLTPAYSDDYKAIRIVKEFSRTEPHAYEADFNDKDGMVKGLFGGLGNVLGNLGIPLISDLAPSIGGLLDNLIPI